MAQWSHPSLGISPFDEAHIDHLCDRLRHCLHAHAAAIISALNETERIAQRDDDAEWPTMEASFTVHFVRHPYGFKENAVTAMSVEVRTS